MIACKQQNNSLILSFCTMFFFILVITLLLPLPSVLSFFLWTLGLTLGTMYRAYGYSPWCVPLVPNCLGHGLYDIAQTFMPPRLTLPRAAECRGLRPRRHAVEWGNGAVFEALRREAVFYSVGH